MKIPNQIKIGAHDVEVRLVNADEISDGDMGQSFQPANLIKLCNGYPKSQVEESLLHEIVENVNSTHELNMEHRVIQSLSACLYQVLHDNRLKFF